MISEKHVTQIRKFTAADILRALDNLGIRYNPDTTKVMTYPQITNDPDETLVRVEWTEVE